MLKFIRKWIHILYLAVGLVSFGLLSTWIVVGHFPTHNYLLELTTEWQQIFVALFFLGHLLFLSYLGDKKELFNVEQLFSVVLLFGGVALFLNYLSEILSWFNFTWYPTSLSASILNLARIYSLVVYLMLTMVLFKKLVFVKKNSRVIIRWTVFYSVLILSIFVAPIALLFKIELPERAYQTILVLGAINIFSLMLRVKWIAFLSNQEKWTSIAVLILINLLTGLLLLKSYNTYDNLIIVPDRIHNVFLIMMLLFVSLYAVISMLALIFNLPINSVLEQQKNEIESFQEISDIINKRVNITDILKKLFVACMSNTQATAGWLTYKTDLLTGEKKTLQSISVKEEEIEAIDHVININNLIYPGMTGEYVYIKDLLKHADFAEVKTNYKSFLTHPIIINGQIIGKMVMLKPYKNGFDEYMIRLAQTYIDQAKIAIENKRSIQEALVTEALKQELAIAERIQKSLLPQEFPTDGHFDVAAMSESAKEVGGDYYDFVQMSKHRFAVVIGDVSGKGTSAAFHMAELKGIFQALIQLDLPPKEFLVKTNSALVNCLEKNLFITLSFFIIDVKKRKLTYCRAGHCPVLYYEKSQNETSYLEDKGIGLGLLRNEEFEKYVSVYEKSYETGDIIVLYSDGIVEARSKNNGEEYGYERLSRCIKKHADKNCEGIKKSLMEDLDAFTDKSEPFDDITMVVIKFN